MDIEYIKQRFNALDEKLQGLLELNNRLILENIKLNRIIASMPKVVESPKEIQVVTHDETTFNNTPKENTTQNTDSTVSRTARLEKKNLEIHFHVDNSVKVIGNTYLHKTILKENGGVWDRSVGGWVFNNTRLDQLVNSLTERGIQFINNCADLVPTGGQFAFQFMED